MNDRIIRRIYARCEWKLETPAHFGCGEEGNTDMSLLRAINSEINSKRGLFFIPGSSIAGAGRSYLARRLLTFRKYKQGISQEPPALQALFGVSKKIDKEKRNVCAHDYGNMSALVIYDAQCIQEEPTVIIRDGVRINEVTGVTVPHAKFDVEVLDRGTIFQFYMECIIRENNPAKDMEQYFLAFLDGFQKGKIRLGAKTRRGYGRGKTEKWDIRDLNMDSSDDVKVWLQSTINPEAIWVGSNRSLSPRPLTQDKREFFTIRAKFSLKTSLLIRRSTEQKDTDECNAPDIEYLQSDGEAVVPGTSLCGILRHRVAFIARTIGWEEEKVQEVIQEMFGPLHKAQNSSKKQKLWISRIQVEEKILKDTTPRTMSRVAIDRFTGGSLISALFKETVVYPKNDNPHLEIKITLEEPHDSEIGLLILALRDLGCGNVSIGGEAGSGRGTLTGKTATLHLYREGNSNKWDFTFTRQKLEIKTEILKVLQKFIEAAKQAPLEIPGSRRYISGKERGNDED